MVRDVVAEKRKRGRCCTVVLAPTVMDDAVVEPFDILGDDELRYLLQRCDFRRLLTMRTPCRRLRDITAAVLQSPTWRSDHQDVYYSQWTDGGFRERALQTRDDGHAACYSLTLSWPVVAAAWPHAVKLWDVQRRVSRIIPAHDFERYEGNPPEVALLTASEDPGAWLVATEFHVKDHGTEQVIVSRVLNGEYVTRFDLQDEFVCGLAWVGQGPRLLVATCAEGRDKRTLCLNLWNTADDPADQKPDSLRLLHEERVPEIDVLSNEEMYPQFVMPHVGLAGDGSTFVTPVPDGRMRVWHCDATGTFKFRCTMQGHLPAGDAATADSRLGIVYIEPLC